MATCKYCGLVMDWGQDPDGKWVKLVPVGQDGDLDRTHQDENGVLRAQHRCVGWTPAVKVVRLAKTIPATDVLPVQDAKELVDAYRSATDNKLIDAYENSGEFKLEESTYPDDEKANRQARRSDPLNRRARLGSDLKPDAFTIKRKRRPK